MPDKLDYLARINLFRELNPEELRRLDQRTPMLTARKGTILMQPGDATPVIYLLKKGRVRLFRVTPDGKELTVALLGDGNIFGETDSFSTGSGGTYAQALSDVLLCALTSQDFQELLLSKPALSLRLVQAMSERLRETEELLETLALGSVRQRLLYLLRKLGLAFGVAHGEYVRIDADLTHEELAHMIGSTRETVTAQLSQLASEGLVQTERKQIRIRLSEIEEQIGS